MLVTSIKPDKCCILRTSVPAPSAIALFWAKRKSEDRNQPVGIRASVEWKIEKDQPDRPEIFSPRPIEMYPGYVIMIEPIAGADHTPVILRARHNWESATDVNYIMIECDTSAYKVYPVFLDQAGSKRGQK